MSNIMDKMGRPDKIIIPKNELSSDDSINQLQ